SHRRHDARTGSKPRRHRAGRSAAAAAARQFRLRRNVGTHQHHDRKRRGARVMTEASGVRQEPTSGTITAALAGLPAKIKGDHLIYLASIAGMIVLWHVIAANFFKPQFFPGPLLVLTTAEEMIASGELFEHISISLQRIITGFLIGSAI